MRIMVSLIVFATLVLEFVANEPTSARSSDRSRGSDDLPCFVEIYNDVRDGGDRRQIRIMIDKDDLNEENLLKLQGRFFAMYDGVKHLRVDIATSLNFALGNYINTKDVEAAERMDLDATPKRKVWERDAQAFLLREGNTEEIGFKSEGGSMRDMDYILLKGEDLDCEKCRRLGDRSLKPKASARLRIGSAAPELPCHFVFGNTVIERTRSIGLFINTEDGRRGNLVALLTHFSRLYPEPDSLVVKVYTHYKQSNAFAASVLGDDSVSALGEYFIATAFRASGNEVIRYCRPQQSVVTIILKGTDIFPAL